MAAWGRYTATEFAPVNQRASLPETTPPTDRLTLVNRLAGQHRHNPPLVRSRFGTGDFRLLPAVLGVISILALLALVAGVLIGWPVLRDGRARLVMNGSVAGLSRVADDGGQATSVWTSFSQGLPGLTNVLAATYQDPTGRQPRFTIVAGRRLTLRPQEQSLHTMNALAGHDEPVSYSTGALGGFIRCAPAHADRYKRVFCLWVDHGTSGFAVFYDRTVSDSAALFGQARTEITVR
jgi:hypothetical protein